MARPPPEHIEYPDGSIIHRHFHPNGNIFSEHVEVNGEHRKVMFWNKDGGLQSEIDHDEDGLRHGKGINLYPNGNIRHMDIWDHGELIEERKYQKSTGKLLKCNKNPSMVDFLAKNGIIKIG